MIFWKEYNNMIQAIRNKTACKEVVLYEIKTVLSELYKLLKKEMNKIFTDKIMDTNPITDEIEEFKKLRKKAYRMKK